MEPGSGYSRPWGPFLPRPGSTFTEGAFGPMSPILPVPVDQPPPGFPRAQPRRWQPYVGYNLPVGQPGNEGYKLASFQTLKTLSETYSILRTCLERRKNEIRALDWDITLTTDAAKAYQGDRAAMRDFGERRAKALKFFRRPDSDYDDFGSWVHALTDQLFVYDAVSVWMCPKRGRGLRRGLLGSDLDELWLLDGSAIRPLAGLHGERPRPPAPGYQQYEFGVPRADLTTILAGLDMDGSEGQLITELRGDQLTYRPYLRRPDSPYGFSLVEQCIIPVMTGLRRQAYQLDYFDESTVPRVYISPGDNTLTANQLRELQDALNATAGDLAWAFKIQVLPPGSKVMPQKEMSIVDDSDNWIATEVAMACCAMGTEILTRSGLKAIEDVRPGDLVMTHRGLWRPVTRVMRSPAGEKDVRRIAAHGFDPLEVTSDHPVWTARYHRQGTRARQYQGTEFLPAGGMRAAGPRGDFDTVTLPVPVMGSSDAVLRPADHVKGRGRYKVWEENGRLRHTRRDVQTLPAEVPMSAALGRILGFYMAEGSIGTSQVFWSFHEDEVAYQQMVIDDLWSVFGLRAKVKPKSDPATTGKVANVVCQSPLLRDLLSCGTATTKSLPGWAWDGPPEFYASLLWAWVAGDGWTASVTDGPTRTRFDGWRGYTASKTLAWQMRMVALACGHPCSFRLRKQPESSIRGRALRSDRGIYALEMRRKINPARPGWYQIESGQHLTSAVRSNDTASYDGDYVYNLEVAGDHSYVTTGGTVHNCDISPVEIGLLPKVSAAASPFAAREMAQASRSIHERTATKPTLAYLCAIPDMILQRICGQDDMRFVFSGMEQTQDVAALTDMGIKQVQSGVRSIDEVRDDLHLPPWGLPETSGPIVITQMGPLPLGQAASDTVSQLRQAITGAHDSARGHQAVSGPAPRKMLPAGTSGQGRMNGPVTQRQARRGGALAPAHATAEGAPGHSGGKPVPKAVMAELEALGRHLRKGMHVSEWVPEHIPGVTMAMIADDLGKGLSASYVIGCAVAELEKLAPRRDSRTQQQRQMAALSARYEPQVRAAFASALSQAQGLIAAWAAGTLAVTAMTLASMIAGLVQATLLAVLAQLWAAAWQAGAADAGGPPSETELQAFLDTEGRHWAELISGTGAASLLAAIRAAIAAGDALAIAAQLAAILDTESRSEMIAVSEVTRGWNGGCLAALKLLGVAYKEWVTRNDPDVCATCKANQAQGAIPLGQPFRSGDMAPLAHVRCRCHLRGAAPPQARKFLRREVGLNGQETWTEYDAEPETTGGRVFQPHLSDGTQVPQGGVPGASAGGEPPRWDGSEPEPVVERAPDADGDAAYGSAPGTGARPGAYWPAPYMDGWWPGPAGHGTQQAGTSSPGARNGRPPNAAGKRAESAAEFLKDAPKASPAAVRAVMRRNFPSPALRWVGKIRWAGPVSIPLELIDTSGEKDWAASHEQGHVDQIAADLKAGKDVNPVIGIVRPGHAHVRMVDGRHRLRAARQLGRPVRAYVGFITGALLDQALDTYHQQVHAGASPQNKSFTAGNTGTGPASGLVPLAVEGQRQGAYCAGLAVRAADTGRVLMIQRAITDADPAAGMFEIPGGHAGTGETLLAAALREWSEEVGLRPPDGILTGHWASPNNVYEGFVLTVPREDGVAIGGPRDEVANPDGDSFEAVAWHDPRLLGGNPAVRPEIRADLPLILAALGTEVAKAAQASAEVLREYWTHEGHPGPTQYALEQKIRWGEKDDWYRCVDELTPYLGEGAKGYCNLRHHEVLGFWPGHPV